MGMARGSNKEQLLWMLKKRSFCSKLQRPRPKSRYAYHYVLCVVTIVCSCSALYTFLSHATRLQVISLSFMQLGIYWELVRSSRSHQFKFKALTQNCVSMLSYEILMVPKAPRTSPLFCNTSSGKLSQLLRVLRSTSTSCLALVQLRVSVQHFFSVAGQLTESNCLRV